MGNSFVLFDVSIVIFHGQFHCGNRGHTQNADFPWVKSHFPVGKRSSGTTANSCGYTCLLPKVTLWVIALGWDRFRFPVRFSPPVTLQIITLGQLLTWQYLAVVLLLLIRQYPVAVSYPKLRVTKNA